MVSPATTDVSRTLQDLIPRSCGPDAGNSKAAWRLVSHSTKERPWHIGERRKPFCARVRDGRRPQEASDALDLEEKVFTREPRQIALSLKRSAERSRPRKAAPFRSAISMPISTSIVPERISAPRGGGSLKPPRASCAA
jgi:hypothetical protein